MVVHPCVDGFPGSFFWHRHAIDGMQGECFRCLTQFQDGFWTFYRRLLAYSAHPTPADAQALTAAFDTLFGTPTGYAQLDRQAAGNSWSFSGNRVHLTTDQLHPLVEGERVRRRPFLG